MLSKSLRRSVPTLYINGLSVHRVRDRSVDQSKVGFFKVWFYHNYWTKNGAFIKAGSKKTAHLVMSCKVVF